MFLHGEQAHGDDRRLQLERALIDDDSMQRLIQQVDPTVKCDDDICRHLRSIMYDFTSDVSTAAIRLAATRAAPSRSQPNSSDSSPSKPTLDVKDVHFVLRRYCRISVPGFGHENVSALAHTSRSDGASSSTSAVAGSDAFDAASSQESSKSASGGGGTATAASRDQYHQQFEAHKNRMAIIHRTLKKF